MLNPIDVKDIPSSYEVSRRHNCVQKEIEDFLASGQTAAEIVFPPKRSALSVKNTFCNSIRAKSYPVRVIMRKTRVFLIKKEADNA